MKRHKTIIGTLTAASLLCLLPGCSCDKMQCPAETPTEQSNSPEQLAQSGNQPQAAMQLAKRVTLPSGLAYEIINESKSDNPVHPQAGHKVTVHYTGWLANEQGEPDLNKKFDSSRDRGTPFECTIGAGQVIQGWDEGVMAMKVGEERRLFIPAKLAYGERGAGNGAIPPNATLVFDVALLDTK